MDVVAGDRGDRIGGGGHHHHASNEPGIGPQRPPPPLSRQVPVREQQDDQRGPQRAPGTALCCPAPQLPEPTAARDVRADSPAPRRTRRCRPVPAGTANRAGSSRGDYAAGGAPPAGPPRRRPQSGCRPPECGAVSADEPGPPAGSTRSPGPAPRNPAPAATVGHDGVKREAAPLAATGGRPAGCCAPPMNMTLGPDRSGNVTAQRGNPSSGPRVHQLGLRRPAPCHARPP